MGFLDLVSQSVAGWGDILNLPEWGISEAIAGEPYPSTLGTSTSSGGQSTEPLSSPWTPTVTTTLQPTSSGGINQGNLTQFFPGYAGWDPGSAWQDYLATGGAGKGGGGGGGGGGTTDPYAAIRSDISGAWDSYINSLDQQLNSLSGQRGAQEGIAQSQFNQGANTLGLQLGQGQQALGQQREQVTQNQARTLRDLSENIRNSFRAGNVYLGARGAGDSSAANQYATALTKMGTRQRSDIGQNTANILNDIGGRETNLQNIYNTEKNNLQEGLDQQIAGIAQWFANAQQTIQMQKAQGSLGKGQDLLSLSKDILNQGLAAIQAAQQQMVNRQSALDSWATSNATNLQQLRANFQGISNPSYQLPRSGQVAGTPRVTASGGLFTPPGYGYETDEKQNQLFPSPFAMG